MALRPCWPALLSPLQVITKLFGWPSAQLFPVLDLLRVVISHPDGATKVAALGPDWVRALAVKGEWNRHLTSSFTHACNSFSER